MGLASRACAWRFGVISLGEAFIRDPLAAVEAVGKLQGHLGQLGFEVSTSSSLRDLSDTKLAARNSPVTPYFDESVAGLSAERFFWMRLSNTDFPAVAIQAFRLDYISTSLADWAPAYTIGLYMRRGEILVPSEQQATTHGAAERLRGKMVYNGELWISPQVRNRVVFEAFSKMGMILALLKWNPDSVWALTDRSIATHGHPARSGFTSLESGFLRWKWAGQGIPAAEWLHFTERHSIERTIEEINLDQ